MVDSECDAVIILYNSCAGKRQVKRGLPKLKVYSLKSRSLEF